VSAKQVELIAAIDGASSRPPPEPRRRCPVGIANPGAGSLTLQTTLLGPLIVPRGGAPAAELEEFCGRATV
jgi:hypothetical protein